jgi:chromosome segregation ATPase
MKTKIVLWGTNAQDERVLIALQLRAAENKVLVYTFPEAIATPDFSNKMMNEWRNTDNDDINVEGGTLLERDLSITESILPDDLKVERGDLIQRAQTEWHFVVLSTKLHENYKSELADLQDKVGQLVHFSGEVFDSLKGFWGKVQDQVRDRNLFREHADVLRDTTNVLFEELKQKKRAINTEFEENSKELHKKFVEVLDEIEKKIENGLQRFPEIFEDLKKTQSEFRSQKMKRDHSDEIWNRIDVLFKAVKEKKYGKSNNDSQDGTVSERLGRRFDGLAGAVEKMQESVKRDKEELTFQQKRVDSSHGQLEAQLRQAKINMLLERIKSKEEKLNEMMTTKGTVEDKLTKVKERDEKVQKEDKKESPKAEAITETPLVATTETAKVEAVVTPSVSEVKKEVLETPQAENGTSEISEIAANANAALDAVDKII